MMFVCVFRTFTLPNLFPRFLHVKPKAKPDEIDSFRTGILLNEKKQKSVFLFPVFPNDYYANITFNLNHSTVTTGAKSVPNSTDVWWELSEQGNNYTYTPGNCK